MQQINYFERSRKNSLASLHPEPKAHHPGTAAQQPEFRHDQSPSAQNHVPQSAKNQIKLLPSIFTSIKESEREYVSNVSAKRLF